jgi:hypothetical protein
MLQRCHGAPCVRASPGPPIVNGIDACVAYFTLARYPWRDHHPIAASVQRSPLSPRHFQALKTLHHSGSQKIALLVRDLRTPRSIADVYDDKVSDSPNGSERDFLFRRLTYNHHQLTVLNTKWNPCEVWGRQISAQRVRVNSIPDIASPPISNPRQKDGIPKFFQHPTQHPETLILHLI